LENLMRLLLVAMLCAMTATVTIAPLDAQENDRATAIFAGGCFWCVEADFDKISGVLETTSGYIGGEVPNPSYEQVAAKKTGHHEAVRITYDPEKVSYEELLTAFWHSIDPTDGGGQFCDRGEPYESGVFVLGPKQRELAKKSREEVEAELGTEVATTIEEGGIFYPAEEYHQNYYQKNSLSYQFYRWNCGRNNRVEEVWANQAYKGIPKD